MARILSGIRCANLRYGAIKCGMDTAQNNRDFLWLGHSLLTVKGDDNQEVAEKLKPILYAVFIYLASVSNYFTRQIIDKWGLVV